MVQGEGRQGEGRGATLGDEKRMRYSTMIFKSPSGLWFWRVLAFVDYNFMNSYNLEILNFY